MKKNTLALLGGAKCCEIELPSWPHWDNRERKALMQVLESGKWWHGENVAKFEEDFAAFQDARYGITTSSGSMALEASLLGMGIEAGDEVIVPPYTFMATATAVVRVNAIPVFADILPDTLCLDPADVERKITARTKAIMPVHLAGHVADMDRLRKVARAHKLRLLEDACHSWGAKWKGKGTGSLGDAGVFSFQVSKNITSAEGGISITRNKALAEEIRSYTNCGRRTGGAWYGHFVSGTNLRMTEFQAAILLAQLSRLERQTERRASAATFLDQSLAELPGLRRVKPDKRITRRACHLYVMRIDPETLGVGRDRIVAALQAEGLPCSPGYGTPLYRMAFFRQGKTMPERGCRPFAAAEVDYGQVSCPVAEDICANGIWLGQQLLLLPRARLRGVVAAVRKVLTQAERLR